jgi:hypothetical protein
MVSSIYQWRHTKTDMTQPSAAALADLARRQAIPDTRDNTGRLLGDPPPGRSALDRKRAKMEQEHADD